jgi:hypothetical protein
MPSPASPISPTVFELVRTQWNLCAFALVRQRSFRQHMAASIKNAVLVGMQ